MIEKVALRELSSQTREKPHRLRDACSVCACVWRGSSFWLSFSLVCDTDMHSRWQELEPHREEEREQQHLRQAHALMWLASVFGFVLRGGGFVCALLSLAGEAVTREVGGSASSFVRVNVFYFQFNVE